MLPADSLLRLELCLDDIQGTGRYACYQTAPRASCTCCFFVGVSMSIKNGRPDGTGWGEKEAAHRSCCSRSTAYLELVAARGEFESNQDLFNYDEEGERKEKEEKIGSRRRDCETENMVSWGWSVLAPQLTLH